MSTTIAPTVAPPTPVAPAPRSAVVTVSDAPEDMRALPAGSTLEAVVQANTNSGSGGTATIQTPYGTLTLKTSLPLPEGAQLLLQMTGSQGDNALLRLVSLDGKAVGRGLQTSLAPPSLSTGTGTLAATAGGAIGQAASIGGLSVEATVLGTSPAALPHSQAGAAANLPPGTRLIIRLTPPGTGQNSPVAPMQSKGHPFGNTAPQQGSPSPSVGGNASTPSVASSVTTPPPPGGALFSGLKSGLAKVIAPLAGGTEPKAAPPAPSMPTPLTSVPGTSALPTHSAGHNSPSLWVGQHLTGTVTAQAAGGRTVLQTQAGALVLNQQFDIPEGTSLTLEVISQAPPAQAPIGQASPALTAPLFSTPTAQVPSAWPTLSESVALLQQTDPAAARQLLASIPSTNPALLANAISFTQAARSGDANKWPGEKVLSALERSGEKGRALAGRLSQDMQELGERTKRAPAGNGGDWRTLPMPFMDGAAIAQITIVTRRPQTADDQPDSETSRQQQDQGQRFLIDLSLSKLGDLQLDGLYKSKGRSFDLIIRTKTALSSEIRQTIQSIFAQSSQALAMKGGVIFRVTNDFPGPTEGEISSTVDTIKQQTATVQATPIGGLIA